MLRFIAALLLVPLLDALLLVVVATQIGAPLTVLIVVLTGLVGMLLVRAEGRHTMAKIQRKLAAGEVPTNEVLDGALLLVAGAFMLTPGLVTDFIGILLIVPLTRWPIRRVVRDRVVVNYVDQKTGGFASGNVYLGGFPFDQDTGGQGGTASDGGFDPFDGQTQSTDTVDLDDDAYDINVEDEDDDTRS